MRHEAGAHRDASADRPQPHRGMARAADASALQGAPWPDHIHSERARAHHLAVRFLPNAPSIGGVFAARGARKRLEAWRLAAALRWRRRLWRGVPLPSSRVQHPILRCDLGAISARSRRDLSRISRAHLGRTTQAPRIGSSARRATRVSLAWRRRNGRARPRDRTSRAGCPSDARRRARLRPRCSRDRRPSEL